MTAHEGFTEHLHLTCTPKERAFIESQKPEGVSLSRFIIACAMLRCEQIAMEEKMTFSPRIAYRIHELAQQDLLRIRHMAGRLMISIETFQEELKGIVDWADDSAEDRAAAELWENMHDLSKEIDLELDRRHAE